MRAFLKYIFTDNINQISLSLDDATKEKANILLLEYISLTAEEGVKDY